MDRGRLAAERERQPCGLSLTAEGWQPPLDGSLPACRAAATPLAASGSVAVTLRSNLPAVVRFSTNGLVLDGGLVVLRHPQLEQQPCLVLGLPLGITRLGRYRRDAGAPLQSSACRPTDAE